MKRVVVLVVAVGVLASGGVLAWFYSNGNEAPSSALTAPTIGPASTVAGEAVVPSTVAAGEIPSTSIGTATFAISSDDSSASFTLEEQLRGVDTTVVGTTDQVAGEIFVDFDNPVASVLGEIVINARTFTTDSNNRTRAVRGAILDTDTFEFITFAPTSSAGLPSVPTGSFAFSVTGDLTVRDITQPVTFDVSVTASKDSVTGTATAIVTRSQFELVIPNVAFVANVGEDVTLTLEFVALPG